ncbi:hypothetical protein BASA82_001027 [Batrachochytrium salamandrivorans]|nr:hypothetical protein BASA82_001027 [Batrachochytrium salamandrivorans]
MSIKPLEKVDKPADIKIILLGDSAVGKSKLMERFLLDDYVPHQLSTYALTLYRHNAVHPKPTHIQELGALVRRINPSSWHKYACDCSGQQNRYGSHSRIKVIWIREKRRQERGGKRQICRSILFRRRSGSNVVTIFLESIRRGWKYKQQMSTEGHGTFVDDVLQFIEDEEKRPDGLFFQC